MSSWRFMLYYIRSDAFYGSTDSRLGNTSTMTILLFWLRQREREPKDLAAAPLGTFHTEGMECFVLSSLHIWQNWILEVWAPAVTARPEQRHVFKGLVEQPKICTWHSQPAWAIVLLGDKKNTEKLLWECYWCCGCIVDWFGKGPLHDRSQPSSRSPQPTHRHVSGPPGALQSGRRLWNFVESDARCEVLISCL